METPVIKTENKQLSAAHKKQLLQPKQLSKKEIVRRQKIRAEKISMKHHHLLNTYLQKAGVKAMPEWVSGWVLKACMALNLAITGYLAFYLAPFFTFGPVLMTILIVISWAATFMFVLFLLWLVLYLTLDIMVYHRRVKIEEVLPDFLLLASANIRAGLPIDQALWYAVRPRFGVLANEIELVAKETMAGEDLEAALGRFSAKYDSPMLRNTVNLLTESINAGGEIGELLNKISSNIQGNKLLQKEMAAGISAYAIIIIAAAIVVAPLLFALASQLLTVITKVTTSIKMPATGMSTFISIGKVSLKHSDFLIFATVNLFFTALFSAIIVTIIRKGEVKAGIRYIPIFVAVSLVIFILSMKLFSYAFGSMI